MAEYLIAGLVLGSIYALIAAGLVVTYSSTGILNFAFGSMAYGIARLYYFLNSQHGWSIPVAAVFCIAIVAPLVGALLWAVLFRTLEDSTTLVKIVATIGLSVAIPAGCEIAFGPDPVSVAPGLSPQPVPVYDIFGTAVTFDQVVIVACILVLGIGGWWVMRFTDIGLVLRAMVSSRALTRATGTNPAPYSVGLWVSTTCLAGLAGVLVAPTTGLSSGAFTLLMASAFAAVIAARFRYIGRAILAGLLLGVVGGFIQRFVPAQSAWSSGATASIPFALIVGFLIYYIPRGQSAESSAGGSALDAAIAVRHPDITPGVHVLKTENAASSCDGGVDANLAANWRTKSSLLSHVSFLPLGIACVAFIVLPMVVSSFWIGVAGSGITFAIAFLSYTLVTGEVGVISLCQITFAGIGAITAAELATNAHLPMPLALIGGGLVVVPVAGVLGYLTTRLGDLYVALITLTFGLLMDNLVFTLNVFSNFETGVSITRPPAMEGAAAFLYITLAIFVAFAAMILLIRRGTFGIAIVAVRSSERGARSIGLNSAGTKVVAMCLGGFIAGIGGGLMAIYAGAAAPENFATISGFVWLAVVVTVGIRSVAGALIAGLTFTVLPAIFTTYLPQTWAQVPIVLFGLGAIFIARNPDGAVVMHARQLGRLSARLGSRPQVPAQTKQVPSETRRLQEMRATAQTAPTASGHVE